MKICFEIKSNNAEKESYNEVGFILDTFLNAGSTFENQLT